MDTHGICDAYIRGVLDAKEKKEPVGQENRNLQEAYEYGYDEINKKGEN